MPPGTLKGGLRIVAYAIGAIGIAVLLYVVVYRLFFQGQDLKRAEGTAVVATENTKAEETITTETLGQVQERQVFRDKTEATVSRGKGKINDAWKGETVGEDVDAAGAAALCELHDSLCRTPPATEMQQIY